MMTRTLCLRNLFIAALLLTIPLCSPGIGMGDEQGGYPSLGPVEGRNQMPILNLFYVMQTTGTETLGKGKQALRFAVDVSNIYEERKTASTDLLYDMEIYRPALHYTYGLTDRLDLHAEVPLLAFGGGEMDGTIQDYHDLFGFPNNNRENAPNGAFGYRFTQNGRTFFDYDSTGLVLSDVNLDLKWKITDDGSGHPAASLRAGVKLPTGSVSKGTGSGRPDFAVGILLSKTLKRFGFFGGLDVNLIDPPPELRPLVEKDILHATAGIEFMAMRERLSLIVQVEGQNSPFVQTGEETFDNDILEIIYGIKGITPKGQLHWQLSMREDLIHHSTVDFTLTFSLGARF